MNHYDQEYQIEKGTVGRLKLLYAALGGMATVHLQRKGILPPGVGIVMLGSVMSATLMYYKVFKPRQAWNNIMRAKDALEANDLSRVKKYGDLAIDGADEKTTLGKKTINAAKEILHSDQYQRLEERI